MIAADLRTNAKPCFWVRQKTGSTAEVDYLHRYRDRLVPVEVKSGRSGTLRSLHQFMQRADHDIAVRLWDGDIDLHVAKTPEGRRSACSTCPSSWSTFWTPISIGRSKRTAETLAIEGGNQDLLHRAYTNWVSWSTPTTPLPTWINPRMAFERMFGDGARDVPSDRAVAFGYSFGESREHTQHH